MPKWTLVGLLCKCGYYIYSRTFSKYVNITYYHHMAAVNVWILYYTCSKYVDIIKYHI